MYQSLTELLLRRKTELVQKPNFVLKFLHPMRCKTEPMDSTYCCHSLADEDWLTILGNICTWEI
jgi:hypothetical protein